jgi:hypothetical protein
MCALVHGYLRRHPDRYVRFNYDWKRIAGIAAVFGAAAAAVIALPTADKEVSRALAATALIAVIAFMVLPKQERLAIRATATRMLRRRL